MANQSSGGRGKCLSYKRTTVLICSINALVALYILHSLYTSFFIFSRDKNGASSSFTAVTYTDEQVKQMEESIRVRQASEPVELLKLVNKLKKELAEEKVLLELTLPVKQKITDEVLQRLKDLPANASTSEQRASLEVWRKVKLEEAKMLAQGNATSNSTITSKEAKTLERVLESDFTLLLEHIGLWIPPEIVNEGSDDKRESEEELEEDFIPGRPISPECHAEPHTDYDGAAVRWGLTHHKESAADCCQACFDQAKRAKPGEMKCNIWVYCPSEFGCFSPDIYEHKHQECWLKQADKPRLNFKSKYTEQYRSVHPRAPMIVPWVSGVVIS